jgi:hypothetical protein
MNPIGESVAQAKKWMKNNGALTQDYDREGTHRNALGFALPRTEDKLPLNISG